jgi:hypothetical protein
MALALVALALPGCRRSHHVIDDPPPVSAPGPFRVTSIELGTALDAKKHVTALGATTFEPDDTVYLSIVSEGAAPEVTLGARWTFEDGEVVSESTRVIMPVGPEANEFHVSKPNGWEPGRYTVEVTADGVSAASRDFEIR